MSNQKVAIITGSTRGIGAAIAQRFSQDNINVVINSVSSKEAGEQLAQELPNAFYYSADISDEKQCLDLIKATLDRFGRLDILVNNVAPPAKVVAHHDLDGLTDELFYRDFSVNVLAPWHLSRAASSYLKASGDGVIINISSIAGLRPLGSSVAYAVSKAALNHLTVLLANILAPEVRVNAIAPGFIETSRVAGEGFDTIRNKAKTHTLLKRAGSAQAIAEMALAIVRSNYMTGEIITIDGGMSLR